MSSELRDGYQFRRSWIQNTQGIYPHRTSGSHCHHRQDRKSTRLNSSHIEISYAVFCLKKKIHHAGFSTLANIGRLFLMQFTLPLIIIVFAFALASLTKNLAQALLGIGIVVVVLIARIWLDSITSHMTGDSSRAIDTLESLLLFGSLILVPVWQFARRRTWTSRATIAACAGVATLLSLIPFSRSVEQSYSLISLSDSPAQFSIPTIPEAPDNPSGLPSFMTEAVLSIPLNVSGVVPGSVVLINGVNLTVDSSDEAHWRPDWVGPY